MQRQTRSCRKLREWLDTVPVIDTHEHYAGIMEPVNDVLEFIMGNYLAHDLLSSRHGIEDRLDEISNINFRLRGFTLEERYEAFSKMWERVDTGSYAEGVRKALRQCWGIEDISIDCLIILENKLKSRDRKFYRNTMQSCRIRASIADIYDVKEFMSIVDGIKDYSSLCRFSFPLPCFHGIRRKQHILALEEFLESKIVCLDDYLESFRVLLEKCIRFGIVCIKDQSAYARTINFSNPTRAEAEKAFNRIISNARKTPGHNEARILEDWLFNHFMRLACEYGLPVQIHTGHMAGTGNDIVKTNAVYLTSLLELHQDVKFDLFHGNWPYMDEYLFLGKNYPNVWLDLCWVQLIDPVYCVEFLKRAIVTVPQNKIIAFGGDAGAPEWTAGYLTMARDNVAVALSEMVDTGWINMGEARKLAADWFFNNPNELFGLGFDRFEE